MGTKMPQPVDILRTIANVCESACQFLPRSPNVTFSIFVGWTSAHNRFMSAGYCFQFVTNVFVFVSEQFQLNALSHSGIDAGRTRGHDLLPK